MQAAEIISQQPASFHHLLCNRIFRKNLVLVLDVYDDLYLLFRMDVRREAGYTHVIDVLQPHVQILGDVMVVPAGDEAELEVPVIDGDCIGVERIVLLTDKFQFGPDLELLEGLAAFPVAESGNVEVGQVDLLHWLSVFASHNALCFDLTVITCFREQRKREVAPKCGTTSNSFTEFLLFSRHILLPYGCLA